MTKKDAGWLKLEKFGEEWKIEDFDPKGKNGRTGMDHPDGEYGGIGVAFDFDPQSHAMRITNVVPNSAAARAALTTGLIVQKIDGTPTAEKTAAECIFMASGRVGTKVWLQLFKPELKQTNLVELTRQKYNAVNGKDLFNGSLVSEEYQWKKGQGTNWPQASELT